MLNRVEQDLDELLDVILSAGDDEEAADGVVGEEAEAEADDDEFEGDDEDEPEEADED